MCGGFAEMGLRIWLHCNVSLDKEFGGTKGQGYIEVVPGRWGVGCGRHGSCGCTANLVPGRVPSPGKLSSSICLLW